MRRIEAGLEHGALVPDTGRFALKSPGCFKEKLSSLIADEAERLIERFRQKWSAGS